LRYGLSGDMLDEFELVKNKNIRGQRLTERDSDSFIPSHELVPQKEYIASEVYSDFAKRHDIHHTVGIYLDRNAETGLRMAFQRGRSQGYYSERETQYLNRLLPHIKRAISLSKQFLYDEFDHQVN